MPKTPERRPHLQSVLASLSGLSDTLPCILFVKNAPDLTFALWNSASERSTGVRRESLLGNTGWGTFPDRHLEGYLAADHEVLSGATIAVDEPVMCRDAERWWRTRKVLLRDDDGLPAYLLAVADDITDHVRLENEGAHARELLEATLRQRDGVLAAVIHDLNGPLNVLSFGAAAVASRARRAEDPDLARHAQRIERATGTLVDLVGDLTSAASQRAGKLRLDLEPFSPAMLVSAAVELVRPVAEHRRQEIASRVPDNLPAVMCDRRHFARIMSNILGNAIKFTPMGGTIAVSAESVDGAVVFRVADGGPGISAPDRARVFEPFWQAGAETHGGMGLGLAIAKTFVEAQGGAIWVDSEVGRGACFSFTLPRA